MKRPCCVFLYSDYPSSSFNSDTVKSSLKAYGLQVEDRGNLLDFLSLSEQGLNRLAGELCSARITDISVPLDTVNHVTGTEIALEIEKLSGRADIAKAQELYDGYWLQRILYRTLSDVISEEINNGTVHMIFTGRLFGTFEDRRYHARVVLMGTPSLISTSGLVEAPARPREYHYIKARLLQNGMGLDELDNMYRGRFVEYDDPKISSIMPSYALQAIMYEITGKAFCDDRSCCLSNSHWQEEVLRVQLNGSLCEKCMELMHGSLQ